jgi:uncharacterized protein DUF1353
MSKFGHFEGDVVTRWLTDPDDDDRDMELAEPFTYVDPGGKRWEAPAGRVINGATIPPWLWSTVGSPYVGNYRRASVIHDVACEDQTEPSETVHLMFYHAMRCGGVKPAEAMVMYQAVKNWGPSWLGDTTIKASMPLSPTPDPAQIERLRSIVQQAVGELGEDATIEAIEARMSENSRRYVPPELK